MSLPQQLTLPLMQTQWASQINPVLSNPIINGIQLTNIVLINGINVINTKLQSLQQGYIITNQNAAASIYRSQPFNQTTLTLTSNAAVTVDIWMY